MKGLSDYRTAILEYVFSYHDAVLQYSRTFDTTLGGSVINSYYEETEYQRTVYTSNEYIIT